MTDAEDILKIRREHQALFVSLKTTVEGILATTSSNVWMAYGGLTRLSSDVENILRHGLRTKGSEVACFWPVVRCLKTLYPIAAPGIDHISRVVVDPIEKASAWVRQSLEDLNLSSHLKVFVSSVDYLNQYYTPVSFLRNQSHFTALVTCLEAVEQNKPSVLAKIDVNLLSAPKKICHTRSTSLPVFNTLRRSHPLEHTPSSPCLSPSNTPESCITIVTDPDTLLTLRPDYDNRSSNPDLLHSSGEYCDSTYPYSTHSGSSTSGVYNSPSPDRSLYNHDNKTTTTSSPTATVTTEKNQTKLYHRRLQGDRKLHLVTSSGRGLKRNVLSLESIPDETAAPLFPPVAHDDPSPLSPPPVNVPSLIPGGKIHRRSQSDKITHNSTVPSQTLQVPTQGLQIPQYDKSPVSPLARRYSLTDPVLLRPLQGEPLLTYLASHDFHTCADKEREDAHFSISEALIAAIEQIKCNQAPQSDEEDAGDEVIQDLKQRIRVRRRQRRLHKIRHYPPAAFSVDSTTTPTTTTTTTSDTPSQHEHSDDDDDDSDTYDLNLTDQTPHNLQALKESGLSLSLASMYSQTELLQRSCNDTIQQSPRLQDTSLWTTPPINNELVCSNSAELVAINLLKQFPRHQLPAASDLQWLVPEEDAPQKLLPLPESYAVAPDDYMPQLIRGNFEWAPPRSQIILSLLPVQKLKTALTAQNHRCTGCGSKVNPGALKRFRYCHYLGKYFCFCCHTNQEAVIPAKVLHQWDFTPYSVSKFSYELLARICNDPLFDVEHMRLPLYKRIRVMQRARDLRTQIFSLKDFIRSCRHAVDLQGEYSSVNSHLIQHTHTYSLNDFISVKKGDLIQSLRGLVRRSITHILQCQLCQVKGFICEMCNVDSDIIFPFELRKTRQCQVCRACFHKTCFRPEKCPKCFRIKQRKDRIIQSEMSTNLSADEGIDS